MAPTAEQCPIEFRLLGTFEVVAGGRALEIGSAKQRALLAMLVLHLGRVVSFDAIVEELWGERPPPSASAGVQVLVSRLRGSLSEAAPGSGSALRAKEPGYVLDADPAAVDAPRFEALAASGRDALSGGNPETAARELREALSLWRGTALADLSDRPFARIEAARLDEARLVAVEELAEAELALGRPVDAAARLEAHVSDHPLREGAWGQLMVALYRSGRQAEALRAYQQLRGTLAEELGLEPTPALRALEARILAHAPDLEARRAAPAEAREVPAGVSPAPPEMVVPPRPGDTVVLLFTDIEASTRRWEGDQEAMAEDLARHDELLRGAVEAARGRVFAHTGDGLCAVFPTARAALEAALAGQLALVSAAWASRSPLRVRMAIHAGSAEPRGDNYVGPTLNRAARLLSLASGGQVLCSQTGADLLRDHVPAGVSLFDLGDHALADLARPERVFQVARPDLASAFPALRSSGRPRHNLPVALTTFVGRGKEVEALRDLLEDNRLVTLAGMGGTGKTRLALEVSASLLERFAGGVFLVDLAPLREPALLASTVATTLGLLSTGGPEELVERLCSHLRERQTLLVLDNCEHLVEACAGLVHTLLSSCPGVACLATSREILGLPGEVPWRVPPLSLPPDGAAAVAALADSDAATLFCERAQGSQPGFALTEANAAAVTQICRRLDGIPLALELAAARIRVLGALELAARLDSRFALLTGGARTALPRHQTLRATMDWSYELLPVGEAALLQQLAVFPASFDLEAAEAIGRGGAAGGDEAVFEVLDRFARLVDKSLVVVESDGTSTRYRLLETVKEYALAKLTEAGKAETARRGHRDFFLGVAATHENPKDIFGTFTEEWTTRSEADYESLRAALEWSVAQGEDEPAVHLAAGMFGCWTWSRLVEGAELLGRVLSRPAPPIGAGVVTLVIWGVLLRQAGRASAAQVEEILEGAAELALTHGLRASADFAHYFLGEVLLARGDFEGAKAHLTAALEGSEASGGVVGAGWCRHTLGWMALHSGDVASARKHFEQAHLAWGKNPILRLHALASLAPVAALAGEIEGAERLSDDALGLARRTPLPVVRVMAFCRVAQAAVLSRAASRSEQILRELVGALRDLGGRAWVDDALEMVALVVEGQGSAEASARLLGGCRALREAAGASEGGARLLSGLVERCRGRLADALGPEGLAEQEERGWAMSAEEALSFASGLLQRPGETGGGKPTP